MKIQNIAGYKFVNLTELASVKSILLKEANKLQMKGTIILSPEGINLTLAGESASVNEFKNFLTTYSDFKNISFRVSFSQTLPFKHLKIKIKPEIITMRRPEVRPDEKHAPYITPQTLKQWLDEKRDFSLLDTRNYFEVQFGTFDNAKHLFLKDFGQFPEKSNQLDKEKPMVLFCTGGIRCEKASLHLINQGYNHVFQLAGGILNYFSTIGSSYYHGECFVFDERVALDTHLQKTGTVQCSCCFGPIKSQEKSCSSCGYLS